MNWILLGWRWKLLWELNNWGHELLVLYVIAKQIIMEFFLSVQIFVETHKDITTIRTLNVHVLHYWFDPFAYSYVYCNASNVTKTVCISCLEWRHLEIRSTHGEFKRLFSMRKRKSLGSLPEVYMPIGYRLCASR